MDFINLLNSLKEEYKNDLLVRQILPSVYVSYPAYAISHQGDKAVYLSFYIAFPQKLFCQNLGNR